MASPYRPHPPPSELELTIVSAKHLKNVNWKTGDLKPYCVFWVDPTHRLSTKSDDSGSTRPVWNERFSLPLPSETAHPNYLTLEVFHSKPSETPKPLVGTLRISLADQIRDDLDRVRTFELIRPSGRPQGKIRVKLGIRDRAFPPPPPYPHLSDYTFAPPPGYYYNPATPPPPPPPPRDYGHFSPPPYSPYPPPPSFYNGYYSSPPPPRPMYYGGAPSAPVDAYSTYDQRQRGMEGNGSGLGTGLGTGLAVGAVAGALGGLALDEGLKYEQDKTAEKVESNFSARGSYSSYRADY